jgi:hypothetical protein
MRTIYPHPVMAVLGRCEVELFTRGQARRVQRVLVIFEVMTPAMRGG